MGPAVTSDADPPTGAEGASDAPDITPTPARTVTFLRSAKDIPDGHLAWAYRSRAEFHERAGEYIASALAAGKRVEYVGPGGVEQLEEDLAGIIGVRGGRVRAIPLEDFYVYSSPGVVDPAQSVAARLVATEEALAAGYTGSAVVINATEIAGTADQRQPFAQFEFLMDQEVVKNPVSAMCAYDAAELGAAAVAEMACLHPLASMGSTPFHLYAEQGVDFGLAGQIDLGHRNVLQTTLARIPAPEDPEEITVDVRGLEFIDHRSLLALAEHARRRGRTMRLRTTGSSVADHLIHVLRPHGLEIQVSS